MTSHVALCRTHVVAPVRSHSPAFTCNEFARLLAFPCDRTLSMRAECTHLHTRTRAFSQVIEAFHKVVAALLEAQPYATTRQKSTEVGTLYKFCLQFWEKTLSEIDKTSSASVCHVLKIFCLFYEHDPSVLEEGHEQPMLKLVQRCVASPWPVRLPSLAQLLLWPLWQRTLLQGSAFTSARIAAIDVFFLCSLFFNFDNLTR